MSAPFTGGCACGAIRYEVNARPITMFNCHCRDCQRATGGAFTPVVCVPAKAFKITKGRRVTRYHSTPTEHGQGITASSLDDHSLFKPKVNMWTSDAQPWDQMDPNLPKFEKYSRQR
jgi:hypothetical protein